MSNIVIQSVSDGDLQTKIEGVPYSTSAREVLTIGDMVKSYELNVEKGLVIDERF